MAVMVDVGVSEGITNVAVGAGVLVMVGVVVGNGGLVGITPNVAEGWPFQSESVAVMVAVGVVVNFFSSELPTHKTIIPSR